MMTTTSRSDSLHSISTWLGELSVEFDRCAGDENAGHAARPRPLTLDLVKSPAASAKEQRVHLRSGHRAVFSDPLCENVNFGSLRQRSEQLFNMSAMRAEKHAQRA